MERVKEFGFKQVRFVSSVSLSSEYKFSEGIYLARWPRNKAEDGNMVFGAMSIRVVVGTIIPQEGCIKGEVKRSKKVLKKLCF